MVIAELHVCQDAFTDPRDLAGLCADLPAHPAELRSVVSQLIVHVSWATRYGIPPDVDLPRETQSVADRLRLTQARFPSSLTAARPPERCTFGTCRDYALMLCSMLRARSIPARVHCGYATYFAAGPYEDHWVCEYWSADETRWIRTDAQLDQVQRDHLGVGFDCADLPGDAFVTAGQAWKLARAGAAAPELFGHGDARGLWFLRVNVYRDLLAMTNLHTSQWDTWRSAPAPSRLLAPDAAAAVDDLACAIAAAETAGDRVARLTELASANQVPPWQSQPATT